MPKKIEDKVRNMIIKMYEKNFSRLDISEALNVSNTTVDASIAMYNACKDNDYENANRVNSTYHSRNLYKWASSITGNSPLDMQIKDENEQISLEEFENFDTIEIHEQVQGRGNTRGNKKGILLVISPELREAVDRRIFDLSSLGHIVSLNGYIKALVENDIEKSGLI